MRHIALALALLAAPLVGCLTVDPNASAAEGAPPTEAPTPPPPSPSTPSPTTASREPLVDASKGRVLYRESFLEPWQRRQWNVSAGAGGRVEASGGYLVIEKGPGAENAASARLLQEFTGDVVVDARIWVSSGTPRAYATVSTPEASASAFFRGAGSAWAYMSWNTFHDGWQQELDMGTRFPGTFYLARHERVGDRIDFKLLSGDGKTEHYGGTGGRFIGDGPLTLSFNIERGDREFLLVDHVEVRELAR